MAQPTNTTNKNANVGFCSLTINARNVATRPKPTICIISIGHHPLSLEQEH